MFSILDRCRWDKLLSALAICLAVALMGCDDGGRKGVRSGKNGNSDGKESKFTSSREFAENFLEALAEGSGNEEMLSTSFKKLIAPPFSETDRKRGYNLVDVNNWLKEVGKGREFAIDSSIELKDATAFDGVVGGTDELERFSLRVGKMDEDRYVVDWFLRTPSTGKVPSRNDLTLLRARDTAQNFLECLLANNLNLAERLLTIREREQIGGNPTTRDKRANRTYDRGWLHLELGKFHRYEAYEISVQKTREGGSEVTFQGTLVGTPGTQRVTVAVTQTEEGWRVKEFRAP